MILVPYPFATADHQAANARFMERAGAATVAELGPHAGVGAQYGRGAGEHADELRDSCTARLNALQDRRALVRGGELVVDVEIGLLLSLRSTSDPVLDRFWLYQAINRSLLYF